MMVMSSPTSRSLLAIVIGCLVGLFSLTTIVGSYYHDARRARADRHFATAESLMSEGRVDQATDAFRAGLALERDDLRAQRGLALALLALGRRAEAATYFADLLRREPTDGLANRGMAQIAAAQSRPAEATAYFQRAIYGQWPDTMPDARVDTRFELVEHLHRSAGSDTLYAELLRLEADVPPNRTALRRRIARMFSDAGAADAAADTLREAAAAAPRDVQLLTELADMEVAAGEWLAARRTLRRALALSPREDLRARAALVDRVLNLDPTQPRLRMAERTRRARRVLRDVLAHTESCAGPDTSTLRDDAQRQVRIRSDSDAEGAERDLELAARIWALAPECQVDTTEARALTEVLRQVRMAEDPQP
jgi:tetratricopeptide (TPR) repeat protein